MAKNNNILYSAAVSGSLAAQLETAWLTNTTGSAYTAFVTAATTFAVAVDAGIANDSTISASGGAALPPTTAAIQEAQLLKCQIVQDLSYAMFAERASPGLTSGEVAALVAAFVVVYGLAVTAASNY